MNGFFVRRDEKMSGRCREVAVSGGSTVHFIGDLFAAVTVAVVVQKALSCS